MCKTNEPLDQGLINSFAERYSLCWEIDIHTIKPVILGQGGASIYCYDEANGLLGLCFCPDDLPGDGWNTVIQSALHCGMKILRDSLSEAYLSFDPAEDRQCNLALAICGAKPVPDSAAQRATMRDVITKARFRKAKAVEHECTMRALSLIRVGADLSD